MDDQRYQVSGDFSTRSSALEGQHLYWEELIEIGDEVTGLWLIRGISPVRSLGLSPSEDSLVGVRGPSGRSAERVIHRVECG